MIIDDDDEKEEEEAEERRTESKKKREKAFCGAPMTPLFAPPLRLPFMYICHTTLHAYTTKNYYTIQRFYGLYSPTQWLTRYRTDRFPYAVASQCICVCVVLVRHSRNI